MKQTIFTFTMLLFSVFAMGNNIKEIQSRECMKDMILVEGDTFLMGSVRGDEDEQPLHKVVLTDFYISKYEVTVAQFAKFVNESGYRTDADRKGDSYVLIQGQWKLAKGANWRCDGHGRIRPENEHNHPVMHVSWDDAYAYCRWLTKKTGVKFEIVTEAQWEYAAKGGNVSGDFIYSGGNQLDSVACYSGNSKGNTKAVGTMQPNELGLYDMTGNVWEWCYDRYDYYSDELEENPKGADITISSYHVGRGGSWYDAAKYMRVADRGHDIPEYTCGNLGFRVAVNVKR